MRKKRESRAFTLLEVMIALALASMLMLFLFDMYREVAVQKIAAEKLEEKQFAEQKVQMRLTEIFSKASLREDELFNVRGKDIFFTFHNGVDADSRFSGEVKGLLSHSKERLELRIRPLDGSGERMELLMENVKAVTYEFFDKEKERAWTPHWDNESLSIPAMIKLKITKKDEKETEFAFFLPPANLPAEYL